MKTEVVSFSYETPRAIKLTIGNEITGESFMKKMYEV